MSVRMLRREFECVRLYVCAHVRGSVVCVHAYERVHLRVSVHTCVRKCVCVCLLKMCVRLLCVCVHVWDSVAFYCEHVCVCVCLCLCKFVRENVSLCACSNECVRESKVFVHHLSCLNVFVLWCCGVGS